MRMLMNNLDPEVAERPDDLVVYGGTGRAARSWDAFDAIVRELRALADDETLLVQSGKPVGVFRTHEWAPRVLIANSNLVGEWANWDEFRRLEQLGLTMYGQMTAGSWIYIGSQGIVQGTYECFAEIARRRFGGSLAGTITLTAGLGGMGGAQPLAVTMNDGVALCIEVDPERIRRRLETRYLDEQADDLDDAIARCEAAKAERRALSVGLCGNAAEVVPELLRRGFEADVVTDQTSAHDPLVGYIPAGLATRRGGRAARARPRRVHPAEPAPRPRPTASRWSASRTRAPRSSTTATACAARPSSAASSAPSTIPASSPPTSGRCSARARARFAGRRSPAIRPTSRRPIGRCSRSSPRTRRSRAGSGWPRERIAFQGLPARICWLGYGERRRLGLRFNELVAQRRDQRPDRDRPRPPRLGLGRLALPRDRGDAGRLRRDRRLAAAERARQHRLGRDLGLDPPRRRGRDRPLDPRRHGLRRRRHRARRRRSSTGC